jgi:hypothetical protein
MIGPSQQINVSRKWLSNYTLRVKVKRGLTMLKPHSLANIILQKANYSFKGTEHNGFHQGNSLLHMTE